MNVAVEPVVPSSMDARFPGIATERRRSNAAGDVVTTAAAFGDFVAIALALIFAFWLRFRSGWVTFGVEVGVGNYQFADYYGLVTVGVFSLLIIFFYSQLYDTRNLLRFRRVALLVLKGASLWLFIYLGMSLALKFTPPISRIYVILGYALCCVFLWSWRWLLWKALARETIAVNFRQRILLIGWNDEVERIARAVKLDQSHPFEMVGYIPVSSTSSSGTSSHTKCLGLYTDLPDLLKSGNVDIVILAGAEPVMTEIVALSNLCERFFVQFKIIPSYFEILVSGLQLETISGVPILGITELPLHRAANRVIKRAVDIVGSIIGICLSAPLIVICGILIYCESPGPIFFTQERIGRNGRRFKMHKLRSMHTGAEEFDNKSQSTLRNDPRLLRIGAYLRKWNLDEVPQFWNVLKGEMSLVGPRPERTFHSEKLSGEIPHYNARYATKPGLTGWAQIHGLRGDTSLVERVRYDLFYLENWSLVLDFQIILLTFSRRDNAY